MYYIYIYIYSLVDNINSHNYARSVMNLFFMNRKGNIYSLINYLLLVEIIENH